MVEHAWELGHAIDGKNVEDIDTAKDIRMRKVKEALYIRLAPLFLYILLVVHPQTGGWAVIQVQDTNFYRGHTH